MKTTQTQTLAAQSDDTKHKEGLPLLCIYHGNCADGFTAAWAVWKRHPHTEFFAGSHNAAPPDCEGRHVVMVDFSYKRSTMISIAAQAVSVLVLDHHKSAQAELVDLPDNVTCYFDMDRSGARLAWEHYHPRQTVPLLVKYVEDRDLWRFNYPDTRAFGSNVFSYDYTFDNWEMIDAICHNSDDLRSFIKEGEAIERKHSKDVRELIALATTRSTIAGFDVPTLNCPHIFSSDAGNILARGEPFAACYWETGTGRSYSLRSVEGGEDVSVIAASMGGGGHKHAAGYSVKTW